MLKKYKTILLIFFITFPSLSFAHVEHYKNLNKIEFDIYRNNKNIGYHVFSFKKNDGFLEVKSEIKFEIKKLGVVLYDYKVTGTEVYKDGNLIKFNSKTNQNGKSKYVNIKLEKNEQLIDGSSFKGNVPTDYLIGTWWNHSLIEAPAQISAVSGRIIKQKATLIGKETIKIDGKNYKTLHFNFSSTDKNLDKGKKLNTDVWYEEESLSWVKATFNKKGKWEYRLINIE
tara:strand:- start:128 stop:811 length:684 start_codon:yes stop_codon:yes gene_type:complete